MISLWAILHFFSLTGTATQIIIILFQIITLKVKSLLIYLKLGV